MARMAEPDIEELLSQFRQLLDECRRLYVSSGELCLNEYPDLVPQSENGFVQLMDDLHRALLVKVFVTICEADRRWSSNERALAQELIAHIWGENLPPDQLKQAVREMSAKAMSLKWYALVRPFDQLAPLRDRIGELETIATRLAHLIARVDGPVMSSELACVKMIQDELYLHLRQIPIDEPDQHEAALEARDKAVKQMIHDGQNARDAHQRGAAAQSVASQTTAGKVAVGTAADAGKAVEAKSADELLNEALDELDRLVGLGNIKQEIRTLTNFLKVQSHRSRTGLPTTELSLHMVFSGNPGTGKTTVARILGKIFGAMGILEKGHLVETDRTGLVAGYAGQTSLKTNARIDESLDGVLFIDEAYSLVSSEGEDLFGHEAIQVLLKRMEDDRERLVVILAGYPAEMQKLLRSNPGLSSRFSRNLEFVDYSPLELAQIFGVMCNKNRYSLDPLTRAKVLLGFEHVHRHRDRFFGNGRTSRNLFEHAIRRMANRIVEIAELSVSQLSTLAPEDIEFPSVPAEAFQGLALGETLRFHIRCAHCQHGKDVPFSYLGRNVRCPKCKKDFSADWGELIREVGDSSR
jgi:AAA+ superfamily predicted ATPase